MSAVEDVRVGAVYGEAVRDLVGVGLQVGHLIRAICWVYGTGPWRLGIGISWTVGAEIGAWETEKRTLEFPSNRLVASWLLFTLAHRKTEPDPTGVLMRNRIEKT